MGQEDTTLFPFWHDSHTEMIAAAPSAAPPWTQSLSLFPMVPCGLTKTRQPQCEGKPSCSYNPWEICQINIY